MVGLPKKEDGTMKAAIRLDPNFEGYVRFEATFPHDLIVLSNYDEDFNVTVRGFLPNKGESIEIFFNNARAKAKELLIRLTNDPAF